MSIGEICQKAEELAKLYNPEGLSPFPFEAILKDRADLVIISSSTLDDSLSGAIVLEKEKYAIVINKNKIKTRQYFTTAHELGHYFLHQDILKENKVIIDGEVSLDGASIMYRADSHAYSNIETEANNFAASLIMPEELIRKAWGEIKNIEKCADIFNVSVAAMAIRLERLNIFPD
ncbi:MAG: ImmA/IrrE family metallo-endopeptidase [Candidatus Paceibacterota bacterium]|jgi:Zn-dependent peptidase ImmA (M78 family)